MPAESTLFKNKQVPLGPVFTYGLPNLLEATAGGNFGLKQACYFASGTGVTGVPDITYNQSSSVVLIPQSAVPAGMRCYVTRCDVDVRGNTPWAGGVYATLSDTNNAPLVFFPTSSLQGMSAYTFPDSDTEVPIIQTASSYNSATGVITLPALSLISGAYANGNCPFTVIGGTGIGQSGLIASNTATTITPVGGAAALPVPLDATSIIAVWYWAATAASTTTVTLANQNGSATPFAVNALDNGNSILDISGGATRGNRAILSNTSSVITVTNAFNTAPSVNDLIQLTNESNLLGALDLCVGDKWPAAGLNQGLQFNVGAGMTGGSPLRVYIEGFFAA